MMRVAIAAAVAVFVALPVSAQEPAPRVAPEDMRWVTPGLADYTDELLFGDVWRRTDLSLRDRSLVTVSALIAGGHTAQLRGHLNRALDNGVEGVVILNGKMPHVVLVELFTEFGAGTLIVR